MKSGELVLIIDSVEEGVKFYTEKLGFDLSSLKEGMEGEKHLVYAHLRKGKCGISLRTPQVEELAAFSFIKRCANRCTGFFVEMKKGIEKYYQKCLKKDLKIATELKTTDWGYKTFSIRDPFGTIISFGEPIKQSTAPLFKLEKFGMIIDREMINAKNTTDINAQIENSVGYLKQFGISRRAGKKFAKLKVKLFQKASKK
ncbi:MAG: hypothetical protein US49_C0001G0057 [candidate division TM6 bacterium GW2011_GWF2_37_49]|nr:MAG: hypothetical protein US49_C0001G0057 [candidate division TM6 bacterium GW2011_GWF2_37_49]